MRTRSTKPKEPPLVLPCPRVIFAVITVASAVVCLGATRSAPQEKPGARSEKDTRTAAQQKIDSQLLYEVYRRRGEADKKGVPPGETGVRIDKQGRALVDVRVEVTPAIERVIRRAGATIVTTSAPYHSIIAWFPLLKLERLAGNPAVSAIVPAADAMTNPKAPL